MDDDRSGLVHKSPTRACCSQTPFVVFAVHVKSLVEPADLVQGLAPDQKRGGRQHSNVSAVRMIPEFAKQQFAAESTRDQVVEAKASNQDVPGRRRIAPRADL